MYRLLGIAVWHGGRWYLRRRWRRVPEARRNLVFGAVIAVAVAVLLAGGRRAASS
jgi:hypothetical protein